ncbi:zinc finger protein 541 [Danio aesculapii]|uniref:zinc finger protein 541 n=1 Tax=Danio aesculapii TaxID=1142201 RepID=UPI0024BF846E|nr:zinc finger protein 541 [Danio aesculapii]
MQDSSDARSVLRDTTYISTSELPVRGSKLWLNTMSDSKGRKTPSSSPSVSVHPKPEDAKLLTPVGSDKRIRVSSNKCHVCSKEFKSASSLKTHLLSHSEDVPCVGGICQRAFKHHDELICHTMIHQRSKTYQCTQPGCHKTYTDRNALKNHCAFRHGIQLTPPSNSLMSSYDLPASPLKPKVIKSPSGYCSLYISKPKPVSAPVLKASGKVFSPFDMGELMLGCHAKEAQPFQKKCQERQLQESCTLATARECNKVEERAKIPTSTQSALGCHAVAKNPVVLLKTGLDFPESHSEKGKKMLPFQANREAANFYTRSPASLCPILLKPPNKLNRQHSFSSFNPSILPETKSGFKRNLPDPVLPPSPASLPNSRKRKSSSTDVQPDVTNPKPTPQKQSRSSILVSPSQVALAFPANAFLQKESILKSTGEEPSSGIRKQRTSSVREAQSTACSQKALSSAGAKEDHDSQSSSSTLEKGQKEASRQKQNTKETLSPLIMPVSVPVSATNFLGPQASTHDAERPQTHKGASKRCRRFNFLHRLIIPSPPRPSTPDSASDRETQVLSPNFNPQTYTPQPMLSPLCPGTSLYSKSLPQYQPCPSSLPCTTGVSFPVNSTGVSVQPRINIGSQFQAEIPPVRDSIYLLYEEHPAQLVWAPWKDLSTNIETQQRVTELIELCCSSVLPGGGTNIELALHCLHEVQGNIAAALDLLLMRGDFRTSWHPLSDYHYTGSDLWTAQEMKMFKKALADFDKDFRQIHNVMEREKGAVSEMDGIGKVYEPGQGLKLRSP